MNIIDIKVYDPKLDGFDMKKSLEIKEVLDKFNLKAYHIFHEGLREKVLDSKIKGKITLRDFLWGNNGYLKDKKEEEIAVIFIDGKFRLEYRGDKIDYSKDLDELAERTNSIPFVFSNSLVTIDYLSIY